MPIAFLYNACYSYVSGTAVKSMKYQFHLFLNGLGPLEKYSGKILEKREFFMVMHRLQANTQHFLQSVLYGRAF